MEVIEEASTPSSSNSATTSRRSSGHGTAVTSVSTATSTSELRDKATSTIDEPSPSTSGVNSGTNSGESTPIGKLSIRVVGDLTKSAPVMTSSSLGDYKIEKSEKKSSTSSSSSSTSANSDDSTNAQLDALRAMAKRREQEEAAAEQTCCCCMNCCHGKSKSKYFRASYYRNNLSFFLTFLVYSLIQIGLGLLQYFLYIDSNIAVRIARVGGILLNFNSGLVILLVLRRLTTWIRNSAIGRNYLPIDDSIKFHKFVGLFIFFLSLMHTAAHCVNLYWLSAEYQASTFRTSSISNNSFNSSSISSSSSILSTLISNLNRQNQTTFFDPTTNMTTTTTTTATTTIVIANPTTPAPPAPSFVELLFTTKSNIGWILAAAMPTGWLLILVLVVMVFFSMPFIRKRGLFQVFYLTHWLHIFYFILLFVHAPNFWKWFLLPFLLLVFERLFTCFRVQSTKFGDTYIRDVRLLSSKVTQLVVTRPPNFKFRSGDYIFIKIPKIARYEWHPFTISSAPELKDELWLHVRSLGNWTNKLYDYFQEFSRHQRNNSIFDPNGFKNFSSETKFERKMSNLVVMVDYKKNAEINGSRSHHKAKNEDNTTRRRKSTKIERNLNISNNIRNIWMDIAIDGPYSTASRRIFNSEQVILIAGGIGVTPFASILQSLWFKYSKSLKTCTKCNHQWYDQVEQKNLKKVDFIWVNRDYQAFEWFIELLGQLELQQINSTKSNMTERFIGIHLYMTSANVMQEIRPLDNPEFDKKGQIEANMEDFSLKLNPGRPDFEQLFTDIAETKKGKDIDVFFCGNREFGKFVQKKCITHKFKFYKEYF